MLSEYTKIEEIAEFGCRRCTILGTRNRLQEQLTSQKTSDSKMTASRKKRIRELQRMIAKLEDVIDLGDFEADLTELSIKLDRSSGPARKQVMFSAPPKLLVLHLSRSSFYEGSFGYSAKNNCMVKFPEHLDMDRFTTSSILNMEPGKPLSLPRHEESAQDNPAGASTHSNGAATSSVSNAQALKAIIDQPLFGYALCAIVVHIGSHSNGHYLTYRRRPRHPSQGLSNDWFRISDEDVEPASVQEVMSGNPFLLFYERMNVRPNACV